MKRLLLIGEEDLHRNRQDITGEVVTVNDFNIPRNIIHEADIIVFEDSAKRRFIIKNRFTGGVGYVNSVYDKFEF